MANLLPNAVYHYKSSLMSYAYGDNVEIYQSYRKAISDTGVFIDPHPRAARRETLPVGATVGMMSGNNMLTDRLLTTDPNNVWPFAIAGYGPVVPGQVYTKSIGLYVCRSNIPNGVGLSTMSGCVLVGSIPVDTILSVGSEGSKLSLTADKMEICYVGNLLPGDAVPPEFVYITGVSMLCTLDGKIMGDASFIMARAVPISGNGFINVEESGGSTNGSFIFRSDGSIINCIKGTNIITVSSGTISQAIPESAMVSNDGLAAVSCMASGDGEARWLGYKNGIYKIYQGPKPHYGMPGERVTIKGHEFVCIVYGPFYARLS